MKLTLKILGWVAMAAFIVVAILVIDVQHAVKHSCRVKIDDDVLATAILARFPFEPYYLSKVVDNVPQSGWQMLLDEFPRHIQWPITSHFGRLSDRQRASLIASHVAMVTRSGRVALGLDRAAKDWLGINLTEATPRQIETLSQHQKRSGRASKKPASPMPEKKTTTAAGSTNEYHESHG